MAKKKIQLEFDGFDEVVSRLNKLGGNSKDIADKALKETYKIITKKAEEAIRAHKDSGATEKSLKKQSNVEWAGNMGSVETGFSISQGGLASIFLMYGTPRMKKDQKLYNAFWSKKTRDEVKAVQEDIFYSEIRRLDG
jgi:hypothetical protein